ncbi:MAG: hypothetical protein CML05_08945 [Pseudozobellia sp.]|nr:hypothetical protein [Pseudozobellia sp.]|tara:strand:- start:25 stop:1173 length:1149 start_codon:yes stop_codon:yes gene_type:complete
MKTTITKILPLALSMGVLISSCSDDLSVQDDATPEAVVKAQASTNLEIPSTGHFDLETSGLVKDFDLKLQLSEVVEPSECGPTPFNEVANYYNDLLIDGFIAAWDGNPDAIGIILEDYFAINQIAAAYEGKNTDYFGEDGEYTNYVKNRVRSLEKFWDMADLIEVNGQHTETLEDLDFIRYIYENYSTATPEDIDYILEIAETFNTNSDQIPENPFFASDGFATFDRTIVVGDGIVTFLEDTGLDPKVVWSSILAHEWGHQIQFLNFGVWDYPVPAFINTPESTRMTELEADFITGYYLTHKRGATYNWKRVEDFLTAFFNIGDCGFDSSGHHGTPAQRLAAAKAGFYLANNTKKKGQILSQEDVHDAFISKLDLIIDGTIY